MPNISAGNRLYLYRLLSNSLGVGKQTLLPRAEEALTADGLCPEDLGCADMRELCEQLGEFVKLTVFKKGYVYATVLANEEYDRALERAKTGADKAAAKGKPWKRRGAKALKPVKPRHVERRPEAEPAAEAEPVTTDETAPVEVAPVEVVPEPEPEPAPEPEPEPEPNPAPKTAEGQEPARADAEPMPAAKPETQEDTTEEADEAAGEPVTSGTTPSISLTITYVPEPAEVPEESPSAAEPTPTLGSTVVSRPQSDLPQDFHADVRCSSEQLSVLYQVLPADVDPMATLEEDFRTARSTGSIEGTRSNVTFSLRYLQADGKTPVRVTLRRSARPVAGKRWALSEVDAGEPGEVGLDGLSPMPSGPWSAFLSPSGDEAAGPERALAQTVALGSWDEALERLAELAAPEPWGEGRRVLRSYLSMTFARIQAEGLLAVSPDGSSADFDTGLLTSEGEPVHASLVAASGDIPWQLAGFSTSGAGKPARYLGPAALATLDPSLPAPEFSASDAVARNPRMATTAYDPVSDETLLLVPDGNGALALALRPEGYVAVATLSLEDAYCCARVVSSEQPSWLAAALEG